MSAWVLMYIVTEGVVPLKGGFWAVGATTRHRKLHPIGAQSQPVCAEFNLHV
jgi:hypothetical protein